MNQPGDNGLWWTLGALGLLGVAAAARGSQNAHKGCQRCTHCGTEIRGSLAVVSEEDQEERWRESALFLQRHDNQSGWLVPYDVSVELDRGYKKVIDLANQQFDSLVDQDPQGLIRLIRRLYTDLSGDSAKVYKAKWKKSHPSRAKGPKGKELYGRQVEMAWRLERIKRHNRILSAYWELPIGQASKAQVDEIFGMGFGGLESSGRKTSVERPVALLDYGDMKVNASSAFTSGGGSSSIVRMLGRIRDLGISRPQALQSRATTGRNAPKSVLRAMEGVRLGKTRISNIPPLKYRKREGRKYLPARRSVTLPQMKREYLGQFISYMRFLYAKRYWALVVIERCRAAGIDPVKAKRAVVPGPGRGKALFDDLTFRLQLAETIPRRAFDAAASRGIPYSKWKAAYSQMEVGGEALVQEQQQLATQQEDDEEEDDSIKDAKVVVGEPVLFMYNSHGVRMSYWWMTKQGAMYFAHGRNQVGLLTKTSKMSSPSFGLPAYTAKRGGTCPAADIADSRIRALSGVRGKEGVICTTCYATGASYGYPNNMTDQDARRRWVMQLRKLDSTGEVAGVAFAHMIAGYAINGQGSDRKGQEIGVWDEKQGVIRTPRGVARPTHIRLGSFQGETFPSSTRDLFKGTPSGEVVGFFRLHDSGDFGLGLAQIKGWTWVARLLPRVYIWTPTRVWVAKSRFGGDELRGAARGWYEAWINGKCSAKQAWVLRGGSIARGSRAAIDVAREVGGGSPGETGLYDWYSDANCDTTVLPQDLLRGDRRETAQTKALVAFASLPNVSCRPSGLYIKEFPDDPVTIPTISGLSAGSGVARKYVPRAFNLLRKLRELPPHDRGKIVQVQAQFRKADADRKKSELVYPPICSMGDGSPGSKLLAYQCPVYTEDAQGKEAKSCQAANCRACWIVQDLPVFYGAH